MTTSNLADHRIIRHALANGFDVDVTTTESVEHSYVNDDEFIRESAHVQISLEFGGNGLTDRHLSIYLFRNVGARRPGLWSFFRMHDFSVLRSSGKAEWKDLRSAERWLSVIGTGEPSAAPKLTINGEEVAR